MKINLYYFWTHPFCVSEGHVEVSTIDWRSSPACMKERVFIKEEEIEIPDCAQQTRNRINSKLVDNLKAEKAELLAETHLRVSKIDEKINQLLYLEAS